MTVASGGGSYNACVKSLKLATSIVSEVSHGAGHAWKL